MENEKKTWKQRMHELNQKISQVFVAMKSPKTPWYAKAVGFIAIAYALSPIDLIPDFIPVLGYLDDLIILPLLVRLCIKLIPSEVWQESEQEAQEIWRNGKPKLWYFAIPIILFWFWIFYMVIKAIIEFV